MRSARGFASRRTHEPIPEWSLEFGISLALGAWNLELLLPLPIQPKPGQFDPQLGDEVLRTDVKRLQQVLKNLLSNALKFTEHGLVKLRMDLAPGGWSSSHSVLNRSKHVIAFSVTDTGIGIAPQQLPQLFERFYRVDPARTFRYTNSSNSGLGLSIVKWIVKAHGGDVKVESQVGQGSTFTVTLPLLMET